MYASIIRDHAVGVELRPYGKNTYNYPSNEPKMSSVHAFFAEIQLFKGRDLKNPNFPEKLFKVFQFKKKNRKMNEKKKTKRGRRIKYS